MWVATEIEVEAAGFDVLGTVALRLIRVGVRVLDLDAVLPPVADRIEVLELHRLRLREVLVALRHVEAVEPGLLRRVRPVEEENVCGDRGIRGEHAARHSYDGMEVELAHQLPLDGDLRIIGTEKEAIREDDRGASVLLETVHDDGHEEVGGLGACEVCREVILHVIFLRATIRRIHQDHIELVLLGIVEDIPKQRVVMIDLWYVDAMQQHIRDAKHVRELLLLDAVDGAADRFLIRGRLHLLLELLQPAHEEAAGTAGEVCHLLSDLRLDPFCHEIGHGSRCIKFARGSGTLQLL